MTGLVGGLRFDGGLELVRNLVGMRNAGWLFVLESGLSHGLDQLCGYWGVFLVDAPPPHAFGPAYRSIWNSA